MAENEKIYELQKEIAELKADLRVAKGTIRSSITVIGAVLFIFFGITYSSLDGIVDKSVEKLINSGIVTKAITKIDLAANNSISEIHSKLESIKKDSEGMKAVIHQANTEVEDSVPIILDTLGKIENYKSSASEKIKQIDKLINQARSLVPDLENLSVSGSAKHGESIKVPSGSIGDWSIIISPKYIGPLGDGVDDNSTVLLSADYKVQVDTTTSWKVHALSRYKFGVGSREYKGEVNYLLIPKGSHKSSYERSNKAN